MIDQIKKIYSLLFIICISLNGCISSIDVKEDLDEVGAEKISCMVNGEPFEAINGKGLLAIDFVMGELLESENSFLITVYSVELLDEGGALAVGFKIGGKNVSDLKVGDTFTTWELLPGSSEDYIGAMGGVEKRSSIQTDEHIFKASSNHTKEISLTITAIDHVAKTMSGAYNFVALDDENNTKVEVTEGIFQNVSWETE